MSNIIYEQYKWLLDAYVLDFYIENHWEKLPSTWKDYFKAIEPELLGNIINFTLPLQENLQVLPLSLLTLRQLLKRLHLPRHQLPIEDIFDLRNLSNFFWKQVKLKKKHEIELMSKVCYRLALETKCAYIIDVGSGLGHLSRMLAYMYDLKVFGLEAQECLTLQARKLDQQLENMIKKQESNRIFNSRPIHINRKVETKSDGDDILKVIEEVLGTDFRDAEFGIVGLHPCGDLGITLLKLFAKCPQIKFINIVGCCYMKLTTEPDCGFPLSQFGRNNNLRLNYCSLEIACHALESYSQRLIKNEYWKLKVHAYRAALEKLIVAKRPNMQHCQITSVKYTKDLSFLEYCERAVSKLGIKFSQDEINSDETRNDLEEWKKVVILYSLRLMLAPLVETIILLDRVMFILESGNYCYISPIFNPLISPRNHVMIGVKSTNA